VTATLLPPDSLADKRFRSVFAALPCGVTVLTTSTPQGPTGMTASAVCSLSLRPQLALACVNTGSSTLVAILEHGSFAINVLGADAAEIAAGFAYRRSPRERFAGVGHRIERGVPVLSAALAWLTCDVHTTYPGGDHTIVVGAVTDLSRNAGEPLTFHDGRYRVLH
jgi:3-hydroxy-9,10-secoandrosta-1,3,5(10)-triene-9,17-dione monooxygenase reductase component